MKRITFEIDRNRNRDFFARLLSGNSEEVWRTSETVKTKQSVQKAIRVLTDRMNPEDYEIVDLTRSVVTHKRQ